METLYQHYAQQTTTVPSCHFNWYEGLDWGCGTGVLIKRLLLKYPDLGSITGYDPVEEMLTQAQIKMHQLSEPLREKVKLQTKQPFNSKFDLIVSSSVFHYLPQPERSLHQFKSLLQDGGKLLLLDYTKDGFLVKHFEWAFKIIDSRHIVAGKLGKWWKGMALLQSGRRHLLYLLYGKLT